MILVSSYSCLCPNHWKQVLSWEWRCSWSSVDRRCSNYIWVINNFIAHYGASYTRGWTIHVVFPFNFMIALICPWTLQWLGAKCNRAASSRNSLFNTLRPRQDGRHFADDSFKFIFLNEYVLISMKISLEFVPKGPINNIPALVQIMAWRRLGDKPLSEPMMESLPTHICVTRPQWVNTESVPCLNTKTVFWGMGVSL